MGSAKQSSADGSSLFGASIYHGKGAGVRSQACDTCGPGRAQRVAQRGKRCQEPKGEKRGPISPSDEIECRKRGGSTPARYDETITCSRSVDVHLAGRSA